MNGKALPLVTIRVNILSVFLTLLIVSFTAVLLFLRAKNTETVSELSQGIMAFVRKEINLALDDLLTSTEAIVTIFPSLYSTLDQMHLDKEQLRSYMLAVIRDYPYLAYFYVGTETGELYRVGDMAYSGQKYYISKTTTPLPEKAAFMWQTIQKENGQFYEITIYLDEQFNALSSEEFVQSHFVPHTRPWYVGAAATKRLYWTSVYPFFDTQLPGITAAQPMIDPQGKLFAVVGADLSFDLLSDYLATQKIGKNGAPFLLDKQGNIVVQAQQPNYISPISPEVVAKAFQTYQESHRAEFEFEAQGISYLGHIEPFLGENKMNWLVAVIVPYDDFFAELESTQRDAILIVIAILFLTSLGVIYLASRISKPIVQLSREIDNVRRLNFGAEERVVSRIKEIHHMDVAISLMRSAVQSFIRYVPKEIVHALFSQNKEIKLGGEKRDVTVFFSDIEGFTSITEEQPTDALMALLSEYFDGLSKIILASQGTIDKYIGDSIMAFWGAPKQIESPSAVCAETALLCHRFVDQFNERCKQQGLPLFKTRFGINAGVAIVGNIGTPERMNYTLIGDMVNAAARIQVQNKNYGTSILIGEAVRKELDERFVVRPIDIVEVKGKKVKIALYELVAMRGRAREIAPTPKQEDLCKRFTTAYEAWKEGRVSEAKQLLEQIHRDDPGDVPTTLFLERLK